MRSSFILLLNAKTEPSPAVRRQYNLKAHRLFFALVEAVQLAAIQTPAAFQTAHGLNGVPPAQFILALLESLVTVTGLSLSWRRASFSGLRQFTAVFSWPVEFELLMQTLTSTTFDSVAAAICVILKDRLWTHGTVAVDMGQRDQMRQEARRVFKFLKFNLAGDVKVVDAADSLVAVLNFVNLLVISTRLAPIKAILLGTDSGNNRGDGLLGFQLSQRLEDLSRQVDIESSAAMHTSCKVSEAKAAESEAALSAHRLSLLQFTLAEVREHLRQQPVG